VTVFLRTTEALKAAVDQIVGRLAAVRLPARRRSGMERR
jgi:hypothetical protein